MILNYIWFGILTVKSVPKFFLLFNLISPLCKSTIFLTYESPNPWPLTSCISPEDALKNLSKILSDKDNQIFHAGTYEKNNKIYSNGGRVLNITALSESLAEARNISMRNINKINLLMFETIIWL